MKDAIQGGIASSVQCVRGCIPIRRSKSLTFEGAWLSGFRIGIHLFYSQEPDKVLTKTMIDSKDHHISFQCSNMVLMEKNLEKMDISFLKTIIKYGGIQVEQVFFHDPNGFMIEICSCGNLPAVPMIE
ncbi:hypothetical protein CARUB_v10016526mg [Capsella rubella]|uniref:VOC domain-containing protein n=1 Tax=Capsella rubella TaxID=81985 RepID=R0ET12_9BRAS|nr:hypothetical protein CARUB_v10016526mg [Capsella rubella]